MRYWSEPSKNYRKEWTKEHTSFVLVWICQSCGGADFFKQGRKKPVMRCVQCERIVDNPQEVLIDTGHRLPDFDAEDDDEGY